MVLEPEHRQPALIPGNLLIGNYLYPLGHDYPVATVCKNYIGDWLYNFSMNFDVSIA